jgi:hypothetical protein
LLSKAAVCQYLNWVITPLAVKVPVAGIELFGREDSTAEDIFQITATGDQRCSVVQQGRSASPTTSCYQMARGGKGSVAGSNSSATLSAVPHARSIFPLASNVAHRFDEQSFLS